MRKFKKLFENISPHGVPYFVSYIVVSSRHFAINYLTAYLIYEIMAAARIGDMGRLTSQTLFFLCALLGFIAIDCSGLYVHGITTQKIMNNLRLKAFGRVIKAPLWQTEALGSGRADVLSRLNNDVDGIEELYKSSLITPLMFLISGIGGFISIWRISPEIAISLCVLGILALLFQVFIGKNQRHISQALQKSLSGLLTSANEIFSNNMNIRIMNIYNAVLIGANKKLASYQKTANSDSKLQAAAGGLNAATSLLQYLIVVIIGFFLLNSGKIQLEGIVFCVQLSGLIVMMFTIIGNTFISLQRSLACFDRIDTILSLDEEHLNIGENGTSNTSAVAISVKDVSVLLNSELSLTIKKDFLFEQGKITAISGASGGGKSSLCKTLLGFYPYDGQITLMGKSLDSYALSYLRKTVSYAPQNNIIVAGTIRENLLLGTNGQVSMDQITEAISVAKCDQWINALEFGLETQVQEGGKNLSGGQRQTLAIGRILLQNSEIIIFDETFSAVDKARACDILENIKKYYPNKTIIIVTHEPEIANQCNISFVL